MNFYSLAQYALFLLVVTALVKPLGWYLQRVFDGAPTALDVMLRPVERVIYRAAGVDQKQEMTWRQYATAFLLFTTCGTLLLYAILRAQPLLHTFDPLFQPAPLTPDLAMNTAVSFATTTTWQSYGGETTMSYLSQMLGLAAQNFLAGAAGLAVGMAFIRGLSGARVATLGNFWVDLVRAVLWVLLPASVVLALVLVWQGTPQNLRPYVQVPLLQPVADASGSVIAEQTLPQGPVAALEAIKNLGTNGGGFFNVNGAHPYANPSQLTNFVGMLAIVALPAALTHTLGRMTRRPRQGWMLFAVMVLLFLAGLLLCDWAEQRGNPRIARLGVDVTWSDAHPGGNMEGKETRFGIGASVLTAITTSNGATGSFNSMHASYMPLGGAVPLVNMLLGEITFGGLGTGVYSLVFVIVIAVFVAGLMIGRTPEYLGKQITVTEMKLTGLHVVMAPLAILLLTSLAVVTPWGKGALYHPDEPFTTIYNPEAHGFTEVFFAYTSAAANNGQNFAGLGANNPFYNVTLAVAMIVGRFGLAIPALALAGAFAGQKIKPVTPGTLQTDTPLFVLFTVVVALTVGALNYLPALALGPLVEHLGL